MHVAGACELPLPPLTPFRTYDTYRLIPTRFAQSEESVLAAIADDDAHLDDLFTLDNATNRRLIGEHGGLPGIGVDELVFGIPSFRIINAAFTYARPEGSRFNRPDRGAWYCSLEEATALAEVAFHKTVEYAEIGRFDDEVSYQAFLADFNSEFHDLRERPEYADCLDPDSYVASQALADRLLEADALGVIFPSVRHPGGTNAACFRPALVGNVRKGASYRLTWSGDPQPAIEKIAFA